MSQKRHMISSATTAFPPPLLAVANFNWQGITSRLLHMTNLKQHKTSLDITDKVAGRR